MANLKKIGIVGHSLYPALLETTTMLKANQHPCKYCGVPSYKTDGSGQSICLNRAETDDCTKSAVASIHQKNIVLTPRPPLPMNRRCHHGKKLKNCKHCMKP